MILVIMSARAGSLSQIDVGTDVLWGINSEGNVYYVSGVTPDK